MPFVTSSRRHATVFILHLSLHMVKEKSEKKRKDVPQDIPQDVEMADATEKVGLSKSYFKKISLSPSDRRKAKKGRKKKL